MSLDFIRGIAIFVNLLTHIVESVTSMSLMDGSTALSTYHKILVVIIMIVSLLFASMRSLFIYVSGFAFGLTYVQRQLKLNIKQGAIESAKIYAVTLVLTPLLLCFSFLERYMTNMF